MMIARRLMHSWHSLDICSRLWVYLSAPNLLRQSLRSRQRCTSYCSLLLWAPSRDASHRCCLNALCLSPNSPNHLLSLDSPSCRKAVIVTSSRIANQKSDCLYRASQSSYSTLRDGLASLRCRLAHKFRWRMAGLRVRTSRKRLSKWLHNLSCS